MVRSGFKAVIASRPRYVRFTPDSGHPSVQVGMSEKCQQRSLREEPFKGVNAVRVRLSEPNKPNRAPIAKVISALR